MRGSIPAPGAGRALRQAAAWLGVVTWLGLTG